MDLKHTKFAETDFSESELDPQKVHNFPNLSISKVQVLLPDGRTCDRPFIEHNVSVAILALNDKNQMAIVQQYRLAIKSLTLEVPVGHREEGESYDAVAHRELL